jgi:hypothetical protein
MIGPWWWPWPTANDSYLRDRTPSQGRVVVAVGGWITVHKSYGIVLLALCWG